MMIVIFFVYTGVMENEPTRKERTHDRIVETAARVIRRTGFDGMGVADIMKEAGLTHGGFYAHFASRDALLVEALERASNDSATLMTKLAARRLASDVSDFRALIETYLSEAHVDAPEKGCPIAALVSDVPRQSSVVREAAAARLQALIARVQAALPAGAADDSAMVIASTMIGAIQLARALPAKDQAHALLAACRRTLLAQHDAP
jgi:TetR/AcrR family transcriptional repressor of nem operon